MSATDCSFTVMPFCVRLCTTNPCCHELHTCAAKNKRPLNKAVANVSALPQRGTAVCCNALQHTTHCNTYEAPHKRHATHRYLIRHIWSALIDTAAHCNTLQHTATHYSTYKAPRWRRGERDTEKHCNTLQHTATHCNTYEAPHRRGGGRDWRLAFKPVTSPVLTPVPPRATDRCLRTSAKAPLLTHSQKSDVQPFSQVNSEASWLSRLWVCAHPLCSQILKSQLNS